MTAPPTDRRSSLLRAALLVAAVLLLALAVLRRPGFIPEALQAARGAGLTGRLLFGCVYLVAALLMLPASPITLGAGHAFGPLTGILVAAPATCLAACLPFLLGRTLLHGPVTRRLGKLDRFAPIAAALRASGFKVVALLRLSPLIPFPVLNYLAGATPLRLRDFAAGSFLGMLPGTVVYAWLGSMLPDGQREQAASGSSWIVLALLVLLTAAVTLLARAALARALAAQQAPPRGAADRPRAGS